MQPGTAGGGLFVSARLSGRVCEIHLLRKLRREPSGERLSCSLRLVHSPGTSSGHKQTPARRPRLHTASSLVFSGQSYGLDIIWVIMRSVSLKILDLRMDSKDFS